MRPSLRRLRRAPWMSVLSVLCLALGSALATAASVAVASVRIATSPSADLVLIRGVLPHQRLNPAFSGTWNRTPISWQAWDRLTGHPRLIDTGAWMIREEFILGEGLAEPVKVLRGSSSLFVVLNVQPLLGRLPAPAEDTSPSPALILSHRLWSARFGADASVLGRVVSVVATPGSPAVVRQVVGVLPPAFEIEGTAPDIVLPLGDMHWNGRFENNRFLKVVARLAPGSTLDGLLSEVRPLVQGETPAALLDASVVPYGADLESATGMTHRALVAVAGSLSGLICLAVLLLAWRFENGERSVEWHLRLSLGARPSSVIGQVIEERGLVVLISGMVAVPLSLVAGRWLLQHSTLWALAPGFLDVVWPTAVAVCLGGGLLVLALSTPRRFGALSHALQQGAATNTGRTARRRQWAVAVLLATALLVFAVAGALLRTAAALTSAPLGFDPRGLVVLTTRESIGTRSADRGGAGRPPGELVARMSGGWIETQAMLERVRTLPFVKAVAASSHAPFSGSLSSVRVGRVGAAEEQGFSQRYFVTPDFAAAVGLRLVRGRFLRHEDRLGDPAAVVSRTLSERISDRGVAADHLQVGDAVYRIVGVVEDIKQVRPDDVGAAVVYVLDRTRESARQIFVRLDGNPAAWLAVLRNALQQHATGFDVVSAQAMSDLVDRSFASERTLGVLSVAASGWSAMCLVLGLVTVVLHVVVRRRKEMAVRLALGASRANLVVLVISELSRPILLGTLVGIAGWWGSWVALEQIVSGATGVRILELLAAIGAVVSLVLATAITIVYKQLSLSRIDLAAS